MDASDGNREVADAVGPFDDILGGFLHSAIDGLLKSGQLDKPAKTLSDLTESIADTCKNATNRLGNSSLANSTGRVSEFKSTADEVSGSWSGINQKVQSTLGELKTVLGVIQNADGMQEVYRELTNILDKVPGMCDNVSVVLHNASMIDAGNCHNLTITFNDTSSAVSVALGVLENTSAENLTSDLDSKMADLVKKLWKKLDVPKLVSDLRPLRVFLQKVVNVSVDIAAYLSGNASSNETSI
jgi:hypothetical protein